MDAVEDVARSAFQHGFRRILVLNGHGGNSPAKARLHELSNELPNLRLNWYEWWNSHSIEAAAAKHELRPAHANWLEAFAFTIVGEVPEGNKAPPRVPRAIMDSRTAREVYGDGSFGGPYRADEQVMHELFEAALGDVLQLLEFA
jgi:creatinine amidohydrolase